MKTIELLVPDNFVLSHHEVRTAYKITVNGEVIKDRMLDDQE